MHDRFQPVCRFLGVALIHVADDIIRPFKGVVKRYRSVDDALRNRFNAGEIDTAFILDIGIKSIIADLRASPVSALIIIKFLLVRVAFNTGFPSRIISLLDAVCVKDSLRNSQFPVFIGFFRAHELIKVFLRLLIAFLLGFGNHGKTFLQAVIA